MYVYTQLAKKADSGELSGERDFITGLLCFRLTQRKGLFITSCLDRNVFQCSCDCQIDKILDRIHPRSRKLAVKIKAL